MDLKIQHFPDIRSLVAEKDEQRKRHDEWMERQKTLRDFYNGRPIMTEEDADDEGLEEITNHLIGYSNMQVIETRYYSVWSNSNQFIDIDVVDEKMDLVDREDQSAYVNKYLNRAIYRGTRFGTFLRSVAGEIAMAGRVACIHKEDSDWCPTTAPKILIPDNVGTDVSELTYFFTPVEFTYNQLEALLDDEEEEESDDEAGIENAVEVNETVVRQLMEQINQQVAMNDEQLAADTENEHHAPTNSDDTIHRGNKTTVNLWKYFEVRYDEDAQSRVVDVLVFTDEYRPKEEEPSRDSENDTAALVARYPAYYESPSHWGHLIVIDASIGGDKRFSTAKGMAEICYNSDVDSEELLNRIYAGEKMRAMPRFQEGESGDEDKILGWNPEKSSLVPRGIGEFRLGGNTGGLNNPLALLQQNSSRQTGASHSNAGRDGELRQQAVERQSQNRATSASSTRDFAKCLESIASEMVRRFFVGDVDPGSPGYEEIMWFRHMCAKKNINLKRLAEQVYGVFENIEVKLVRSSVTGEIDHDMAVAERLMANLQHYPAALRPFIVNKFTTLISGDPDFANDLVALMPKIVSAQRVTAESEFEQIARDASLGQDTPLGEDDVHIEHIPTHNKHLRVILNRNLLRPWTREDAVHFAGIQEHQQKHFNEALSNSASRADAEQYLRAFQDLVNEGDALLQGVERAELEEEGRSGAEVERELKLREQARKERETAIKEADTRSNIEQRESRRRDVRRKGDQQFILSKEKLDRDQPSP